MARPISPSLNTIQLPDPCRRVRGLFYWPREYTRIVIYAYKNTLLFFKNNFVRTWGSDFALENNRLVMVLNITNLVNLAK